jgi:D-alanyl-D-alanine carboxypeptidase/D-alanyl-D-alanine-endopeptidase (penicillin-binding protein 4)
MPYCREGIAPSFLGRGVIFLPPPFLRVLAFLAAALVSTALPGIPAGEASNARNASRPARTSLESELNGLVARFRAESGRESGLDVAVVVIGDQGETLVDIRGREALKPASNMKILTTAAGLHWLGAGHEYETTLSSQAPLRGGRIAGDVVLRGTGDPNISGRFRKGDPTAIFREWARKLGEAGLRRIDGDVVADDTYFDEVRLPPTWDPAQEEAWYSAQVSALSLNDNCIDVTVKPGSVPGARAKVILAPPSGFIALEDRVRTSGSRSARILVHRRRGTNEISVTGEIGAKSPPWSGNVTVHDPALFFASSMVEVFEAEGIDVGGRARRIERREGAPAEAQPAPAVILLRHVSTLAEDLPIINKRSQNLHAEILLRTLGARIGGEGSLAGGDKALRAYLEDRKIDAGGLVVGDGSGLSHANRASAHLLAAVLDERRRSGKDFELFLGSLPVGGEDGTLDDRFRSFPLLRGKVHAKTGYIHGVSCLSGYVRRGTRTWSFSVLVNGLRGGAAKAKALQEKVAERMYSAMSP